MKSYPITDHVPESELTAITPEGAARWLKNHGWEEQRGAPALARYFTNKGYVAEVFVTGSTRSHGSWVAALIRDVAFNAHAAGASVSPRTIIAEMQADSRIAAECARMAARSPKATQVTENKDGDANAKGV